MKAVQGKTPWVGLTRADSPGFLVSVASRGLR